MDNETLKRELIAQMGSSDNATALAAVDELREKGWLSDGSLFQSNFNEGNLRGGNLSGTSLSKAMLVQANLNRANLTGATLIGAYLRQANLSGAYLSRADLRGTNLENTNVRGAILRGTDLGRNGLVGVNLMRANLREADLTRATLYGANLQDVDLRGADLSRANLAKTNLQHANLIGANLTGAQFSQANLHSADLTNVQCAYTKFTDVDLSNVKGLDQINHYGPSYIDFQTLQLTAQSGGSIPESFLRGIGLSDDDIQFVTGMYGRAIHLYSAFISYSHKDQSFVDLLYNTLQGNGVRCWQDNHEIDPGQKIYHVVSSSIRIYDKILLICSKSSLNSRWVHRELEMALQKEEELSSGHVEGVIALIPVDIDGYLFSDEYQGPYKAELVSRLAARFKGWDKDHSIFEREFGLLMRSLNPGRENRSHPEPKLKKKR